MRRLGFALSLLAVVATAAFAYHVNYRTKTTLGRVDRLRGQIAAEREAVEVLRVEWAYLNAPERLSVLVARHNGLLGLEPMGPQHFGDVAAIPFPQRHPEPDDAAPRVGPEALVVAPAPLAPLVGRVPLPTPRPVGWRLE